MLLQTQSIASDTNLFRPMKSYKMEKTDDATNNMSEANGEERKYQELCKFYCSPYTLTGTQQSSNTSWRYRNTMNSYLKPLPKLEKLKVNGTNLGMKVDPHNSKPTRGSRVTMAMDIDGATMKNHKPKGKKGRGKEVVKDVEVGGAIEPGANGKPGDTNGETSNQPTEDDNSSVSQTITSSPIDSTSMTSDQSGELNSSSTKSKRRKNKKKVQFMGVEENPFWQRSTPSMFGKYKVVKPLKTSKPFAFIKDEKTGKLPVIYEEKGVLPPIVEKYTTTANVSVPVKNNSELVSSDYRMAANKWRMAYSKIRPTRHMRTFTEVVFAVRARMDLLQGKDGSTPEEAAGDMSDSGTVPTKQEKVKIVKTSVMPNPTLTRINATGVKKYPIEMIGDELTTGSL